MKSKAIAVLFIIMTLLWTAMALWTGILIGYQQVSVDTHEAGRVQIAIGDVNQDGVLSEADLDIMVDFILLRKCPTIKQLQLSDLNGDGKISSSDLTILCRQLDN